MRNFCEYIYGGLWCFCILALARLSLAAALQPCATPTRANGFCIPITECSWFTKQVELHGQSNLPSAFVNFVRRSECFVENKPERHMCCDAEFVKDTTTTSTSTTTTTTAKPTPSGIFSKFSLDEYTSKLDRNGLEILNETKCGYIYGNRVAHGENTSLYEFPWMALLRYDTNGNQFQCGGSLITTKFVLTAAHCIVTHLDLIGIRLGEWDLSTNPDSQKKGRKTLTAPPVEDIGIAETIVHPDYNKYRMVNDVALVKLDTTVTFKVHIKPICLPIGEESIQIQEDQEYFIAGWGTTENGTTSSILQKAKIAHQSRQFCLDIFKTDSVNDDIICAGGTSNVDSCKGDSGGPLFFTAPYAMSQRYVQYGIVSFGGIKCGRDRAYPGIYANVVQYMPWITSKLK